MLNSSSDEDIESIVQDIVNYLLSWVEEGIKNTDEVTKKKANITKGKITENSIWRVLVILDCELKVSQYHIMEIHGINQSLKS